MQAMKNHFCQKVPLMLRLLARGSEESKVKFSQEHEFSKELQVFVFRFLFRSNSKAKFLIEQWRQFVKDSLTWLNVFLIK